MWNYYSPEKICLNVTESSNVRVVENGMLYNVSRVEYHKNYYLKYQCDVSYPIAHYVLDGHYSIYPWRVSGICNGCIHYKGNSNVEV